MKNKLTREILLGIGTWLVLSATVAVAGVTDSSIQAPANYSSFLPPAAGSSYQDPAFGTTIKRVTNARGTADNVMGGNLTWALAEYSTPAAFNNDNSRFLLQHDGYFAVYDGNGAYLKDATYEMTANTQPRWSRSDNNVVYYERVNQLKSYNAATNAVGLVHTFAEYGAISGNGESDLSWDGDHVVLVGDGREVFVYTISSGQKSAVFNTNGNSFDSVYISADNKVTITWNALGTGRFHGIELFDSNMGFIRQITQAGGHMDMSRDVNGDPVLVWTNANDPAFICENGIVKVRLSDGQQTCIANLHLDWNLAVHISGADQGWVVVSTYAPADPAPGSNWPAYTNEVFRMKLDGSVVERLAHHRSRPHNSYNWQAWATISRDGSRILYNSNYNLQVLQGAPSEYSDVYMINVVSGSATPTPTQAPRATATPTTTAPPATATATSTASTPTPVATTPSTSTHLEETNAAVKLTGSWSTNANGVHSGGSAALSMDSAADATVTFTGAGITWRGVMDPWSGQAEVYVDGALQQSVDSYSAGEKDQFAIYAVSGLAAANHTLRIHVKGTKGAASGGAWVWVDSFDVVTGGSAPTATATATATRTPTATATSTATATVPPTATATTQPTAPAATTRLEQTSPSVQLSGSWFTLTSGVHSGGSSTQSMDNAGDATVTFVGTGVTWLGSADPYSGQADVYLDGSLVKTVDAYSATERNQQALYAASGLVAGAHTLRIHARGTKSPASGGAWIWVDAFDVTTGGAAAPTTPPAAAAITRVEETSAAIQYVGGWYPNGAAVHSGASAVMSMEAEAKATFTFTGTGIRWIGYRDEWSGLARVLVDGAPAATVDTYGKPGGAQQVLFEKIGLTSGSHVITVVATGTRSASSGGAWVWLDGFDVIR
jgi:hypothetical protein